MNPVHGILYGCGAGLICWSLGIAFLTDWWFIAALIGLTSIIAGGLAQWLDNDPLGYRDTVFGHEPDAVVHQLDDYRPVWPSSAGAVE
jgi:hypothetical protein